MPRLNLTLTRTDRQTLGATDVYYERIRAMLAIGDSGQVKSDCLVDTGAPLTLFPQRIWERFEDAIKWLYLPASPENLPDWLSKVTGLGGQSVPCRIGRINIQLIELPLINPPRMSPQVEILAKFPEDGGAYTQILLGLGGGVFANWRLVCDYPNRQVWLEYDEQER